MLIILRLDSFAIFIVDFGCPESALIGFPRATSQIKTRLRKIVSTAILVFESQKMTLRMPDCEGLKMLGPRRSVWGEDWCSLDWVICSMVYDLKLIEGYVTVRIKVGSSGILVGTWFMVAGLRGAFVTWRNYLR